MVGERSRLLALLRLIAVLTVTGFALYWLDLGIAAVLGGYDLMRLLHAVVSYLLIPYTILHGTLQWFFGRFWTIFKVQIWRPHVLAGLVALAVATPIAAGAYFLDGMPSTLTVPRSPRSSAPPFSMADPGDPVWAKAKPVIIHTAKATNSPGHVSDITVRAVHDGANVYFQLQWDDPDVSFKRYPLVKTEGGWKVLQTAFETADENAYYEDKLSMYVTNVKNGSCASTCHLGVGPAAAKATSTPSYTTGGEYGDVWNWKSVRTNPMASSPVSLATWTISTSPGAADQAGDRYTAATTRIRQGRRVLQLREGGRQNLSRTLRRPQVPAAHNDAVHTNAVASTQSSARPVDPQRASRPLHQGSRHLSGGLPFRTS